ncbi:MAG: hypothetical protein Q4D04_04510 [Clostridia bacterium]|nr:hypothetical protein [Clostridia bacterium]
MRKILIILTVILTLATTTVYAQLDSQLISDAKQALTLMSYGEYKKAIRTLNFSSNEPTASELSQFVDENMPQILDLDVQSTVAVAYYDGTRWLICIPVEQPSYDSVTAFVLRSRNGTGINGIGTMLWYEVLDGVAQAEQVIWQDEYHQGDIYFVADER